MSKIKANTIENVSGTESHDVANMGIESGSNANGNYTKFPDGTLICTGLVLSELNQTSFIYTYPVQFLGEAVVSVHCIGATNPFYTTSAYGSETEIEIFKWNMDGTENTQNRYMNVTAIGRWK